jgi:hypothetical protein
MTYEVGSLLMLVIAGIGRDHREGVQRPIGIEIPIAGNLPLHKRPQPSRRVSIYPIKLYNMPGAVRVVVDRVYQT